nr:hemocyanin-like 1 (Hcl-1) gene [Biomphalaria glabrata]
MQTFHKPSKGRDVNIILCILRDVIIKGQGVVEVVDIYGEMKTMRLLLILPLLTYLLKAICHFICLSF